MKVCLEKVSIEERHEELVRNEYTQNDQYSATHKNALADGDLKGKGTGHMGHSFWLPNCNGQIGIFNYSNFDTAPSSNAGNKDDRESRHTAMSRSVYNSENPYSVQLVDTSDNVAEGQYVMK